MSGYGRGRRGVPMALRGKRGISPLIATVLLIAFAVALGSVVYTYIIAIVDADSGLGGQGCARYVSLEAGHDGLFSYEDGVVRVSLFNAGLSRVSAVTYSVEGSIENHAVSEHAFPIAAGVSETLEIGFDADVHGDPVVVYVTPHYIRNAQQEICPEGRVRFTRS